MLQVVGQSRAQLLIFVDTTGLHPDLHRRDRGGGVRLEQHGQSIGQNETLRSVGPERLQQSKVGNRGYSHAKRSTNTEFGQDAKRALNFPVFPIRAAGS